MGKPITIDFVESTSGFYKTVECQMVVKTFLRHDGGVNIPKEESMRFLLDGIKRRLYGSILENIETGKREAAKHFADAPSDMRVGSKMCFDVLDKIKRDLNDGVEHMFREGV